MNEITKINEVINIETQVIDDKDAELFMSILHPDMVWPWCAWRISISSWDWELHQSTTKHLPTKVGEICKMLASFLTKFCWNGSVKRGMHSVIIVVVGKVV